MKAGHSSIKWVCGLADRVGLLSAEIKGRPLEHLQGQKERHDDNIKQQRRIGRLTFALISVAIIQAAITMWSELHTDPTPSAPINSEKAR